MYLSRRAVQRAQLRSDGHKAMALINNGASIVTAWTAVGGSRARFYRALYVATDGQYSGNGPRRKAVKSIDPLLL
jgi:hypothetical protein